MTQLQEKIYDNICEMDSAEQVIRVLTNFMGNGILTQELANYLIEEGYATDEDFGIISYSNVLDILRDESFGSIHDDFVSLVINAFDKVKDDFTNETTDNIQKVKDEFFDMVKENLTEKIKENNGGFIDSLEEGIISDYIDNYVVVNDENALDLSVSFTLNVNSLESEIHDVKLNRYCADFNHYWGTKMKTLQALGLKHIFVEPWVTDCDSLCEWASYYFNNATDIEDTYFNINIGIVTKDDEMVNRIITAMYGKGEDNIGTNTEFWRVEEIKKDDFNDLVEGLKKTDKMIDVYLYY